MTSKPHWTVKQLAKRAEEAIRDKFCLAVSTALVLALSRDSAAPFYGLAADFFADEVCEVCVLCSATGEGFIRKVVPLGSDSVVNGFCGRTIGICLAFWCPPESSI